MKRTRFLISFLLVFLLLLGIMPAGHAIECSDSPDGSHHWESWEDWNWIDPCTADVWTYEECWYCGATRNWAYDRTVVWHVWDDWYVVTPATCSQEGTRQRTCKDCGLVESETFLTAHSYGAWEVVTPATDHSQGTKKHCCEVCGHEEQQAYDPEGTLRIGDRGTAVRDLQLLLIERGFLEEGLADGDFGEGTESAVKDFQRSAGLTEDGVAWPQTIRRLDPNAVIDTDADCCVCWLEEGEDCTLELVLSLCEEHAELYAAAGNLPAQNGKTLWGMALDAEYEEMLNGLDADAKATVEKEREAFKAWLDSYEEYLTAIYPEDEEKVSSLLADATMRHCAVLCCLNDAGGPLPEMLTTPLENVSPKRCAREERAEENVLTSSIDLCQTHLIVANAASALPADQAVVLWNMCRASLSESLETNSADGTPGTVIKDQKAFVGWLNAYEAMIRQFRPDQPKAAPNLVSLALMEYVAARCGEIR